MSSTPMILGGSHPLTPKAMTPLSRTQSSSELFNGKDWPYSRPSTPLLHNTPQLGFIGLGAMGEYYFCRLLSEHPTMTIEHTTDPYLQGTTWPVIYLPLPITPYSYTTVRQQRRKLSPRRTTDESLLRTRLLTSLIDAMLSLAI